MNYKTDFGIWSGIFAVPSSVVDEHLRLAGAAQLKALLYCLRHSQKSVSDEELSGALGISKADAADAVQYWVHAGVLSRGDDKTALQAVRTGAGIIPSDSAENNMIVGSEDMRRISAAAEGAERALSAAQKHIPAPNVRPTGPEVNRRATEDPEVSYLLQEAQLRLSRMISPGESSTLVYLHDYYGLPSEVILLAMELAAKRGRCNMRYIEKVAVQWSDEGINTLEAAEKKIDQIELVESSWNRLLVMIGLDRRAPTPNEMKYLTRWLDEWGFSLDAIRLAYYECADNTHKVIFRYINKVLENWHNAGAHTAAEIEKLKAEAERHKTNNSSKKNQSKKETSFDLDEYEKLTNVNPTI